MPPCVFSWPPPLAGEARFLHHPCNQIQQVADILQAADIRELDATTLNRLIRVIVIHEDLDGETVRQTVEIHWNFMGSNENT